jgi:YHS domain-containing protein
MLCLVLAAVCAFAGCKKSEPAVSSQQAAAVVATADANSTDQTMCPVMGGPIDKNCKIEYQGKTVYFCCPGCIEPFKKDPAKYLSKLPQFKTK